MKTVNFSIHSTGFGTQGTAHNGYANRTMPEPRSRIVLLLAGLRNHNMWPTRIWLQFANYLEKGWLVMNKLADAYLAHPKCITCGECITTHEWQNLCNIRTGRNDEPLFQVDPLDDYCARHTSLAEQDYSFAGTIQQINRQLDYLRMLCERAVDAAKFEAEKGIDDGNT